MCKAPKFDKRTEEALRKRMLELAASYTPEWKPNPSDPDMGMALLNLFAQMHYGTIRRLNGAAEKNRISFCRFLGTFMRPSEVSSGYVKFSLSSQRIQEEVLLPAGTVLTAEMPEGEEENSGFTTMDDVCITNTHIEQIMMTDGEADVIRSIYDCNTDGEIPKFVLFEPEGENLNRHIAEIGCKSGLLHILSEGTVSIRFRQKVKSKFLAEAMALSWRNGTFQAEYFSNNGWETFSSVYAEDDVLYLKKSGESPSFSIREINNIEADWIRLTVKKLSAELSVEIESVYIGAMGENIKPDVVITRNGAAEDEWFMPFDDIPMLFDSVYIASDEALSKSGSVVTMHFTISFPPPPEVKSVKKPDGNWKMIMRKSDLHIEEQVVSWVSEVVWEYFNGKGWKPISGSTALKRAFSPVDGVRSYVLEFQCPFDAEPILIDAEEHRFIRARITKLENMYMPDLLYHMPLMSHIIFEYNSQELSLADHVCTNNQMISRCLDPSKSAELFVPMMHTEPALYFGISAPLKSGPYRILMVIEKKSSKKMPVLRWEYAAGNSWRSLNCYDDTGHFDHTGLLVLSDNTGFQKRTLFNKSLYWIRVVDDSGRYQINFTSQYRPHILRIDFNCAEVKNSCEAPIVYFDFESAKSNLKCRLPHRNISKADVWVDELSEHGMSEIDELLKNGTAAPEYDMYGMIQRLWIKWEQTEHFWFSQPEDRHYQIDYNEGIVIFGDGRHGKIPCSGSGDRIRIHYHIGGGISGNIPEGTNWGSRHTLGLVTGISNPLPFYGGNNMESLSEAAKRTAAEFQNCGRCVTAKDYEQMALQAHRGILKVKCIAGYNSDGKKEAGSVTLIIMLSDFGHESSGFEQIREKLRRIINKCRAVSLLPEKFYIIHPFYLRICVNAEIIVSDGSRIFRIKEQVQRCINEFLHPITGNFNGNGWKIGEFPHQRQIENAIISINGVAYVKSLVMRVFSTDGIQQTELDSNHLTNRQFCLAVGGTHIVTAEKENI